MKHRTSGTVPYSRSQTREIKSRGLQQWLSQGQQLEGELPNMSNIVAATQSQCVTLQSRFSTLKDTASSFASQVKRVVGDMNVVKQAVTKEEFAALLLNLCSDATMMDLDLRLDRKSTRLNSSHRIASRMPSSA